MYLNVIPPPPAPPLPSVRGLGQVRLIAPPGRHRRGMGQGPAGAASCAQYIANALAGLPSPSEAAMLLNTGAPSGAVSAALYLNGATSAQEAAQAFVQQLAQEYCGAVADEVSSGDPNAATPGDCGDGGASCAQAAYQVAYAFFSALPPSAYSTGMVSPAQANPTNPYLNSGSAGSAGGAGMTAANVPVTATISNQSRPGQSFQVGDTFVLTITGPPNSEVIETSAVQSGKVISAGGYSPGSTDATGKLVITNSFGASDVGSWQETWGVAGGSNQGAAVNFSVAAAPAQSGGSGSGGGSQSSSSGTNAPIVGTQNLSLPAPSGSSSLELPSWLTSDIGPLPIWGWALVAVGAFMFLPRGR